MGVMMLNPTGEEPPAEEVLPVDPTGLLDSSEQFRALVRAAFRAAKLSGKKQDWYVMTTPVLKNRLLQLTQKEFKEADYGATHLLPLLRKIPDLVEISEGDGKSLLVRLVDADAVTVANSDDPTARWMPGSTRGKRVRHDLWRAVLDYKSHVNYVFDDLANKARPQTPADDSLQIMPTLLPDELKLWRSDFIETLSEIDGQGTELSEWTAGTGRTVDLPSKYQPLWNDFLKKRVIDRLVVWFESKNIAAPLDLLVGHSTHAPNSGATATVTSDEILRETLITAIQYMDYESLLQISVPATALLALRDARSAAPRRRQ